MMMGRCRWGIVVLSIEFEDLKRHLYKWKLKNRLDSSNPFMEFTKFCLLLNQKEGSSSKVPQEMKEFRIHKSFTQSPLYEINHAELTSESILKKMCMMLLTMLKDDLSPYNLI